MTLEEDSIDTLPTHKAEFTEQMETKLEEIARSFQKLELDFMKTGEIEARARIERARKELEERRDSVQKKLAEARKAGDSAFVEARAGVISAWQELTGAFEKAREELEGVTA